MKYVHAIAASLAACASCAAYCAPGDAPVDPVGMELRLDRSSLEVRLGAQHLTGGYGNWREGTLLGNYEHGSHRFRVEAAALRRFGESGAYLGLMDVMTLDPEWFASVAAGAGDGAFYLPRYRVDATINRRLLAARNLVASLGLGYYRAPDGHIDSSVDLGGSYYLDAPWVVQASVRFNDSRPGDVRARQQIIAVTYGREPGDVIIGRYSWGREAYLATGPNSSLVDFASREASVAWRHRFGGGHVLSVGIEQYRNSLYERTGVAIQFLSILN